MKKTTNIVTRTGLLNAKQNIKKKNAKEKCKKLC